MTARQDEGTLTIAPMRRRHLASVLKIEGRVYPRPWSLSIFLSEIAMVDSRHYFVALEGRKVVGYCGLMTSLDEGHITNIAVDPRSWGRSIATRLLVNAFEVGRRVGSKDLTLEVRASNERAQRLYFRFGFRPEGVRKAYYTDNAEDAIIMWSRDIGASESLGRIEGIRSGLGVVGSPSDPRPWESGSGV